MNQQHFYKTAIHWTGNTGKGTETYKSYQRSYQISIEGKPDIEGSSDPTFLGDKTKYNPEELLLASISSCHLLWYLHLCANEKIVVIEYSDTIEHLKSIKKIKFSPNEFVLAEQNKLTKQLLQKLNLSIT